MSGNNLKIKSITVKQSEIEKLTPENIQVLNSLLSNVFQIEYEKPKNNVLYELVKPEMGQVFYHITGDGEVYSKIWRNDDFDNRYFNINNVFLTEENAQKQADRNKLLAEIQRFADENNEAIDWKNPDNSHIKKYYIAFYVDLGGWVTRFSDCYFNLGITYFSSENLANQALKKFKDRLDILLD